MRRIEDMIAEAAAQVYGEEWEQMTGEEQKNIIMGFIAESARREAARRAAAEKE